MYSSSRAAISVSARCRVEMKLWAGRTSGVSDAVGNSATAPAGAIGNRGDIGRELA